MIEFKSILVKSAVLLLITHIPHLLLFLGVDAFLIVAWVGMMEQIPAIFVNVIRSNWFELGEFGIIGYTWQGFVVSIISKYLFFVLVLSLLSIFKSILLKLIER